MIGNYIVSGIGTAPLSKTSTLFQEVCDEIKDFTEGTFYISSPAGQSCFDGYTHSENVVEIEMPDEWFPPLTDGE